MAILDKAKVWRLKPPNYKVEKGYQFTPLTIIFDVKQEYLRRKSRMVAGGHKVDSSMYESYSSMVQTRTIRLLETVALNEGLTFVTGDIENTFVQTTTKEKVYSVAGPESGDKQESIILIKKALHGLTKSVRQWSLALGDQIRAMGFEPTRADLDL